MNELWKHLIEAQNDKLGIPPRMLDEIKKRLKIKKEKLRIFALF